MFFISQAQANDCFNVEGDNNYKCSLTLSFDARSDVPIDVGLTGNSTHAPQVLLELSYNDSATQTVPLSMNYSLGYAQDVLFLHDDIQSITLYSVTINYSCSY